MSSRPRTQSGWALSGDSLLTAPTQGKCSVTLNCHPDDVRRLGHGTGTPKSQRVISDTNDLVSGALFNRWQIISLSKENKMLATCQHCPGPGDERVTVSVLKEAEITLLWSPHKDFEKERSLCVCGCHPECPVEAGTLPAPPGTRHTGVSPSVQHWG